MIDRRGFLFGSAAGAVMAAASGVPVLGRSVLRTPAQTEGPFYPDRMPIDIDADLVQIRPGAPRAQGTVTYISGRVLDPAGRPVSGARVEIWQCDNNGRYLHSGDRRTDGPHRDPHFQGFGHAVTDAEGAYRFRTIRPVSYPGRTPHIHYRIDARNFDRLTTQLYVEGEPQNMRDGLFRSIPGERREAVLTRLDPAPELEAGALAGRFDIVLGA